MLGCGKKVQIEYILATSDAGTCFILEYMTQTKKKQVVALD